MTTILIYKDSEPLLFDTGELDETARQFYAAHRVVGLRLSQNAERRVRNLCADFKNNGTALIDATAEAPVIRVPYSGFLFAPLYLDRALQFHRDNGHQVTAVQFGQPGVFDILKDRHAEIYSERNRLRKIEPVAHPVVARKGDGVFRFGREEERAFLVDWCRIFYPAPDTIAVENANYCNLRCQMCPIYGDYSAPGFNRGPRVDIAVEEYRKILSQAREMGVTRLQAQVYDEPFLHPRIFEFIDIAKTMGFEWVHINTNGTPLNDRMLRRIAESGLDSIAFSIDAATEETYRTLRRNSKFRSVEQAVETLARLIRKRGRPEVSVSLVSVPENRDEIDAFIRKWVKKVDYVRVDKAVDYKNKASEVFFKTPRDYVCPHLWKVMMVLAGGDVVKCCGDFTTSDIMGNVRESTLKEIWLGRKYMEYRRAMADGKLGEIPLCAGCDLWRTYGGSRTSGFLVHMTETPLERSYRWRSLSYWMKRAHRLPPRLLRKLARTAKNAITGVVK